MSLLCLILFTFCLFTSPFAFGQAQAPFTITYTNIPASIAAGTFTNLTSTWNTNVQSQPLFLVRPGYGFSIELVLTNKPAVPLNTNNGGTVAVYFARTIDGGLTFENPTNFVFSNLISGPINATNTFWDSTGTQSNQLQFVTVTNVSAALAEGDYGLLLTGIYNTGTNAVTPAALIISRGVPQRWPGPSIR